jgi:hypothetical protein
MQYLTGLMTDRPKRRRRLIRIVIGFVVIALAPTAWFGYRWLADDWALQEAIGQADRLDPGWRLAELEAKRAAVPDEENGALQVLAAGPWVPLTWPKLNSSNLKLDEFILTLPPRTPLNKEQVQTLRTELGRASQALGPARQLAAYSRGKYAITWSQDAIGTPVPHVQFARTVANLLSMDAMLLAHDGDMHGSLLSCRACLNAGRSLGDETVPISQLVRFACREVALHGLERTLAQVECAVGDLKDLQGLLEDEDKQPILLIMARADRAILHQALGVLKSREFNRRTYGLNNPFGLPDEAMNAIDAAKARACHAAFLRVCTDLVEIAKLPPHEQSERLKRLSEPDVHAPTILRSLWGQLCGLRTLVDTYRKGHALLRSAIAALAAERFRQQVGRWPTSLDELVPHYLHSTPMDPYDGKVLRFRRLDDGIVIYALGPDGQDNAGVLSRDYMPLPGTDIGFRLWDPTKRMSTSSKRPSL